MVSCDWNIYGNSFRDISLGVLGEERPTRVLQVASSITDMVILKTLKMVVIVALNGAQGCGVSMTIDSLSSEWMDQ